MSSGNIPGDLLYTDDHEWLRRHESEPAVATVGITDFAQDQLGDVVYVDLPAPGTSVLAGEVCGEIESTKTVAELYAPAAGVVTEVNGELADAPELVNSSPYGDGWMIRMRIDDSASLEGLLNAAAYRAGLAEG